MPKSGHWPCVLGWFRICGFSYDDFRFRFVVQYGLRFLVWTYMQFGCALHRSGMKRCRLQELVFFFFGDFLDGGRLRGFGEDARGPAGRKGVYVSYESYVSYE